LNGGKSRVSGEDKKFFFDNMKLLRESGKRLLLSVDNLVEFSGYRYYDPDLNLKMVSLGDSVERVFAVISPEIRDRALELRNSIDGAFPFLAADEMRLDQVLYNLIENSVDHTEFGVIEVTAETDGNFARIGVYDNGAGMEEADLAHVFEPFSNKDTGKNDRLGLGLTICRQIVEQHGGDISAASESGKGTTVTFSMPLWSHGLLNDDVFTSSNDQIGGAENDSAIITQPSSARHKNNIEILIADEDPATSAILKEYFSESGYDIVAISDWGEFTDYLKKGITADLVLMGESLSGISGHDALKKIRKRRTTEEMPVIIMLDVYASIVRESYEKNGANDYIVKPVKYEEVNRRVSDLLVLNRKIEQPSGTLSIKS